MWLFPYFMESLIKAVLPSLTMLDYKVTANSVSPRISPRGVLIFGLKMTLQYLFPFETKMRHKNKKNLIENYFLANSRGLGGRLFKGGSLLQILSLRRGANSKPGADLKLGANSSIYGNYFYDSIAFCWISFASCTCKVQCSVHLLRVLCENPSQLCIFSVNHIVKL